MEHRNYDRAEPKRRGRDDQAGGARWWKTASRQKQQTKKKSKAEQRKQENEGCKGARAVTSEKRTPGSRILHSKTRGVKFDRTGVVSSKLANRKKVVNHLRSNKNMRKTRSRTHGGDRKARPITNHDRRRTRRVWGSDRREDTSIGSGVERGARVGDPLGAGRRRQSHGAEGLCQSSLVPPPRPGRLLAGLSGRGPGRREEWSSASEHGRRW